MCGADTLTIETRSLTRPANDLRDRGRRFVDHLGWLSRDDGAQAVAREIVLHRPRIGVRHRWAQDLLYGERLARLVSETLA